MIFLFLLDKGALQGCVLKRGKLFCGGWFTMCFMTALSGVAGGAFTSKTLIVFGLESHKDSFISQDIKEMQPLTNWAVGQTMSLSCGLTILPVWGLSPELTGATEHEERGAKWSVWPVCQHFLQQRNTALWGIWLNVFEAFFFFLPLLPSSRYYLLVVMATAPFVKSETHLLI